MLPVSVLGIPTGDTHITRDLGTGVPKTRGYPNHCDSAIIRTNVLADNMAGMQFLKYFYRRRQERQEMEMMKMFMTKKNISRKRVFQEVDEDEIAMAEVSRSNWFVCRGKQETKEGAN